jgi:hypothetical protein
MSGSQIKKMVCTLLIAASATLALGSASTARAQVSTIYPYHTRAVNQACMSDGTILDTAPSDVRSFLYNETVYYRPLVAFYSGGWHYIYGYWQHRRTSPGGFIEPEWYSDTIGYIRVARGYPYWFGYQLYWPSLGTQTDWVEQFIC